jgi:hypothetical protein
LKDIVVEDPRPAGGNRAHRQLRAARNSQFADDEHVERRIERRRDFERHRHPAARQRQDHDISRVSVLRKVPGEHLPGMPAIAEGPRQL